MERKYRGAQRMAAFSFGERERDLTLDLQGDCDAIDLYRKMVSEQFPHAAEEMIARWRKRYPANTICPEVPKAVLGQFWPSSMKRGPHLLGHNDSYWSDRCKTCHEFSLAKKRAESRGFLRRKEPRVQQSQHRPGAPRTDRLYRANHQDWPWVKNPRGEYVLQRSWKHLAGKLLSPDKLLKMSSYPTDSPIAIERKRIERENDRLIKEELERRRTAKAA